MYILVNYTKEWGIAEVGRFDTWQDAAREIATVTWIGDAKCDGCCG